MEIDKYIIYIVDWLFSLGNGSGARLNYKTRTISSKNLIESELSYFGFFKMENTVKREISSKIEWYKKVIFAKNVS